MSSLELALIGQLIFWLLMVLLFLISGQASLYHPLTMYLGFHAIVFIIRPFVVHWLGFDTMWNYMMFEPSPAQFMQCLAVSSVALAAFAAASLAGGWCVPKFPAAASAPFTREQIIALGVVTALLLPVVARSIFASVSGEGTGQSIGGVYVLTGATGYTLEAQYMIGPLICAWLAVARFRWPMLVLVGAYLLYRSYGGWSRWTILLLFVAISLLYAWQKRIKWPPLRIVLCAVPLLMLFNLLGHNRDYVQQLLRGEPAVRQELQPGLSEAERLQLKYDGSDFANFDFLTFVTAVVPERTGTYTYGSQYLQLFTEPIPRKLWPGKPIGAPISLFSLNQYGNFVGMTVTLPGDGWMSGGWIGLIITMSIVGAALGLWHRWFWRRIADNVPCIFYMVGLAMLPQWYRDGGISIAKFLFWNLAPLILWVALTWAVNGHRIAARSVLLAPGTKLRFVRQSSGETSKGAGVSAAAKSV